MDEIQQQSKTKVIYTASRIIVVYNDSKCLQNIIVLYKSQCQYDVKNERNQKIFFHRTRFEPEVLQLR